MATYTINESTARLSHEMRSWSDYHAGSATREYEAQVAQAAAILEQVKAKCFTEEQKERAEYLFDRYAKTLAEATNKENEIGTRCPSVMICGAGNFPVRKKQKQIKAFEANRENWRKAEHYLDQLKRAHTLAVKDSDPEVLDFLRAKLAGLEAGHELMISANAYYRKHKTLDGFEGIPEKTLAWITFLSTPSARRATSKGASAPRAIFYFYPRPPRGGRPARPVGGILPRNISIHALREEGDSFTTRRSAWSTNFYPRPPRGGRPGPLR